MADFLRYTRDLIHRRRALPALRAEPIVVYPSDPANRVLAYQRWVPGAGRDVVVVISLNESTLTGYRLGFPRPGRWSEVFNSDYYDHFPNPWVAGNHGGGWADGPGTHGFGHSAALTIPANSVLVFAAD